MSWSIEFPKLHSDEGPARSRISFGHQSGNVRGTRGAKCPRCKQAKGLPIPDDFQSMDGFFFGFWTINTRWWMPLFWGDPMFHALYISIRRHCFTLGVLILPWPGMIPSASFMWNKVVSFCLEVQLENHWRGSGKTMHHNLNPNRKHLVVLRYKLRDVGTRGNPHYFIQYMIMLYIDAYVYITDGYTEFKRWQFLVNT